MSTSRPGVLKVGDRVRFDGSTLTVVGLSGTLVRLAAHDGQASVVQLPYLLASEGFEVIGGTAVRRPSLSASSLSGLRPDVADEALRWERHIVEILTGADPEAPPGSGPRPGHDLERYSLAQREQAKAAELAAAGEEVTARTVKRKRQRYESQGLAGLVDHRADRATQAAGRTDERVLDALQPIAMSDPTVAAAAYPQVVALTRLITSPYWLAIASSAHALSLFQQEMRRTVAPAYRWPQPTFSKDPLHRWIIGGNRRSPYDGPPER